MSGYQKPGYNKPAAAGGYAKPAAAKPVAHAAPATAAGAPLKGNKPAFRLAIVEKDGEGKYKTVKDAETGKTSYVGAAWTNDFGGFNVKFEGDVTAGTQVRMYPVEDKPAE